MARNKECLVIVLDVRESADADFKQKSIKCVAEILKDKICAAKKDFVSLVLLGSQRTYNDLNNDVSHDGYLHIVQYPHVQVATWQLLVEFFKFVKEDDCSQGEWLDALVVAMEMIKNAQDSFKFQHQRILLFYDFNGSENNYDMFDTITENILKLEIGLIVVSPNIMYTDNPDDDKPQSIFSNAPHKSDQQIANEEYALRLVSTCNATLCNFKEALNTIFRVPNRSPWIWNAKFSIGCKLHIAVSGVLAMKDESNIKLKKHWAETDAEVSREWKYYVRGDEVLPEPEDMIDAYMLGATPIPHDEPLTEHASGVNEASLKFLGFAKRDTIPQEYYSGKTLYWLVHRRGMAASARKMDALVRALHKTQMAVLCWKIYSAKWNKPRLVVLLPNEIIAEQPATLSMIELSYHAQHHFWDFPAMRTQKSTCTAAQVDAIDQLIDAMDLTLGPKEAQLPRSMYQKDLLPFDTLPHIYEQNVMDVLERKVLRTASDDDEQFLKMLADKNFVDIFWQVPEIIEERSKAAAKRVKQLFPLEKGEKPMQKAKARAILEGKLEPEKVPSSQDDSKPMEAAGNIVEVGQLTPAEDFTQLLEQHVLPLHNNITLRYKQFCTYASQMRVAIWSLLFTSASSNAEQIEKIAAALRVYRQSCLDFSGIDDYNVWLEHLKADVVKEKLFDFWHSVIVKEQLGLCIVGKPSLDERVALEEFYSINDAADSAFGDSELNDDSVDDLLAKMQ